MEFVEIRVSSRSKGHLLHVAGSFDSCSTDGDSCPLGSKGDFCEFDDECCSGKCRGKQGAKTCN